MQTAAVALATALTFGTVQAFGREEEQIAVVHEVADDWPGPELPIELHLGLPDGPPQDAWVVIRPWLLPAGR